MIRNHISEITAEMRRRVRNAWRILTAPVGSTVILDPKPFVHAPEKKR